MNIKLKTLILLGYLLMVFVAIILSITGIYFIQKLSFTPDSILSDNYKSIRAAQNMIDEIDNMDNAVIMYISDKSDKSYADKLFFESSKKYFENLVITENNVTEKGELELVRELRIISEDYEKTFLNNKNNLSELNSYDSLIFRKYKPVKVKCYELLNLNYNGIIHRRDTAVKLSENAVFYMIIISAFSIFILIIAALKIPSMIINPVIEITDKVEAISDKKYSERVEVKSDNELGKLGRSINKMAKKLEEYEISNIEKLIAEKKRAEAIVKSMVDGILVLNENDEVVLSNNIISELLGISEENIYGKNIFEIAKYNNLINTLLKDFKNPVGNEKDKLNYLRIVHHEKEEFYLNETVKVTEDENEGKELGNIIILKNVTGFKELDELKSGFVATVSHELRTPLSAINMSLRLLQDNRVGKLNEEQTKITSAMKDEVKRLLKLVSELLNLSKIESGGDILNKEYVKIEELIDAAVTPLLLQLQQKNLELETKSDNDLPDIKIDINKIAWVLINLLNNAVRYSRESGKIILEVKKQNNELLFSVKDFGKGIEPNFIDKIFDKFVQVDSKKEESYRGVGLGLAISKEFVTAHGGKINVKSEPGKGSEFYFTIPYK